MFCFVIFFPTFDKSYCYCTGQRWEGSGSRMISQTGKWPFKPPCYVSGFSIPSKPQQGRDNPCENGRVLKRQGSLGSWKLCGKKWRFKPEWGWRIVSVLPLRNETYRISVVRENAWFSLSCAMTARLHKSRAAFFSWHLLTLLVWTPCHF